MNNVYERAASASIALPATQLQPRANQETGGPAPAGMARSGDAIRRLTQQHITPLPILPHGGGGAGTSGSLPAGGGIVAQLLAIVEQLLSLLGLGTLGGGLFGGGTSGGPPQGDQFFRSATATSAGDPHLGFSGTAANGAAQHAAFDSMTGHDDLLDSDSFSGGYQISTSVTQPAANGVTYNQQATVSTNFGDTQITLDKDGDATILQNGQPIHLANGQRFDLGNGETVSRSANGSVIVSDDDGLGGSITTTLSENGNGVDVNAQAANVDLGGDLLAQPQGSSVWPPVQTLNAQRDAA